MRRIAFLLAAGAAALVCAQARAQVQAEPVWLCHPHQKADPCARSLSFTAVNGNLGLRGYAVDPKRAQPVDCFYVYPSVSTENRGNSDLKPGIEETDTAWMQASWFSPFCRVYAPMYRQVTTHGDGNPYHGNRELEYTDVLAAWREYLAKDNKGRGVVLIGHSEGGYLLKRLIQEQIEDRPDVRRRLVSAILLGANVLVGNASAKDGDFQHVPPCTSLEQTGCVVAYSTWDKAPPASASFERTKAGQHVLCVNPAAPGSSGAADVTPLFLTTSFNEMGGVSPRLLFAINTDWVSYPNLYKAQCMHRGGQAWLQVTKASAKDRRPAAHAMNGAGWGLHPLDVNIALFELVGLVGSQATAYLNR